MSDARLVVGGKRYGGWKSVRITRSIENLAGSFDLEVNDQWSDFEESIPIAEEDACKVVIAGETVFDADQTVIDGYVDRRSLSFSDTSHAMGYSGRDKAAALVDCSAAPDRWTYRNASLVDLALTLCLPYGIGVSLQPGLTLPRAPSKTVINPGDTVFQVLERAAQQAGVLVVSDGAGGVRITRAGSTRAKTALVEGQNIKAGSVEYDGTQRFSRYVIGTQIAGTDNASGSATRIKAEATDAGVRRTSRVLLIRPETGTTKDFARQRADWEARIRAAKAETVNVTVCGWRQPGGELWPVNAIVRVQSQRLGVDGDMLISQVDYSLDGSGETTQLRLVRPDAFTPEPVKATVKATGAWKELAGGAR